MAPVEERVDSRMIARLLDLAAPKFRTLVIDMPPVWRTWCENVVRGVDKFFFVSDMSVAGLRHARTLAGRRQRAPITDEEEGSEASELPEDDQQEDVVPQDHLVGAFGAFKRP